LGSKHIRLNDIVKNYIKFNGGAFCWPAFCNSKLSDLYALC